VCVEAVVMTAAVVSMTEQCIRTDMVSDSKTVGLTDHLELRGLWTVYLIWVGRSRWPVVAIIAEYMCFVRSRQKEQEHKGT